MEEQASKNPPATDQQMMASLRFDIELVHITATGMVICAHGYGNVQLETDLQARITMDKRSLEFAPALQSISLAPGLTLKSQDLYWDANRHSLVITDARCSLPAPFISDMDELPGLTFYVHNDGHFWLEPDAESAQTLEQFISRKLTAMSLLPLTADIDSLTLDAAGIHLHFTKASNLGTLTNLFSTISADWLTTIKPDDLSALQEKVMESLKTQSSQNLANLDILTKYLDHHVKPKNDWLGFDRRVIEFSNSPIFIDCTFQPHARNYTNCIASIYDRESNPLAYITFSKDAPPRVVLDQTGSIEELISEQFGTNTLVHISQSYPVNYDPASRAVKIPVDYSVDTLTNTAICTLYLDGRMTFDIGTVAMRSVFWTFGAIRFCWHILPIFTNKLEIGQIWFKILKLA